MLNLCFPIRSLSHGGKCFLWIEVWDTWLRSVYKWADKEAADSALQCSRSLRVHNACGQYIYHTVLSLCSPSLASIRLLFCRLQLTVMKVDGACVLFFSQHFFCLHFSLRDFYKGFRSCECRRLCTSITRRSGSQ